jgi:hypothetical protein
MRMSLLATGDMEEITRLVQQLDLQSQQILKLKEERKTLKVVVHRQEKAFLKADQDAVDLPRLVHQLNEEVRVLKASLFACLRRDETKPFILFTLEIHTGRAQ